MCDCREVVNERLAFSNARIAFGFTFSDSESGKGRMDLSSPMITLEKIDRKKRGHVSTLLATCCPFCGERYKEDRSGTQG
jgi:hypothetical protein